MKAMLIVVTRNPSVVLGLVAVTPVGLFVVILLSTDVTQWHRVPAGAFASVTAAAIAGLVALSINDTWDSRKKADLEAALRLQREDAYTSVIQHAIEAFQTHQAKTITEARMRALAVVWGSESFLSSLTDLLAATYEVMSQYGGAVPEQSRQGLQLKVAMLVAQARNDFGFSGVAATAERIAGVIFDDFDRSHP